ncbi:MAG: ROK family protein [Vicinamibacterales bacterium]|nr:ROK family protein [Vicinamibacterales bacterium]
MRIGIDLGGTKIEAVALDEAGRVLVQRRVPSPRGDYAQTIEAIAAIVAEVEREAGGTGTVGVGMPGVVSPVTGLVKNANSTWLIGRAFDVDLAARLGRPVRVTNDANAFALSEAVDGAAAGAEVVFGVILGTGVGGGLVVGGRVITGANAIAGEWGHNPLPWPEDGERPGPACYCGRAGCIETWLSGPGLARDFAAHGGAALSAFEIGGAAEAGDPRARAALDRYAARLARALAHVINLIDPDVIVLGGGVSNLASLPDAVTARWAPWVFSDEVRTRLVRAAHGDASGVRGAAWLWPPATGESTHV